MKIVHLTSVHNTFDIRILYKQAVSLVDAGHHVTLISASESALPEIYKGVRLIGVRKSSRKLLRSTLTCAAIIKKAMKIKADIYHFHDPELIPWCLLLHILGKRIVMDVHEDYKKQIMGNVWMNKTAKYLFSFAVGILEKIAAKIFYGIVTVDEPISEKFRIYNRNARIITAKNYPVLNESIKTYMPDIDKYNKKKILFLGGLMSTRCAPEFIRSLEILKDREYSVYIGGNYNQDDILKMLMKSPIYNRINFLGKVNLEDVESLLIDSSISINLFSDHPNHYGLRSNRLYESLAAGLPVIVSNFPATKEFVDTYSCGLYVDPHSPEQIAFSLQKLLDDPELAMKQGLNGRRAVLKYFSWDSQAFNLMNFYSKV